MPMQSTQSFAKKMGAKLTKAHEAHKADDTRFGQGGDLPGGVDGIALLTECKLGQFNAGKHKGEYFFYAAGVVVEPVDFVDKKGNKWHTEGRRTSIMEALCDTPEKTGEKSRKTFDDHYDWVLNELRKLGQDTKDLGADDFEPALAILKEAGIYFRFSTREGKPTEQYPDPMIFHEWQGATEYTQEGEAGGGTQDNTEAVSEPPAPAPTKKTPAKAPEPAKAPPKPPKGKEAPTPAPEPEDELTALADRADAQDADAANDIAERALAAGIEQSSIENASSYAEVADMIRATEATDEEAAYAGTESTGEWEPEKDDTYKYAPIKKGPGGKVMKGALTEVQVLAVDKAKKTVKLKNLADGKTTYVDVSWDSLESNE